MNSCDLHQGKTPFRSGAEARRALAAIKRRGERRDKKPMRSYACPGCGRHFLTSRPR